MGFSPLPRPIGQPRFRGGWPIPGLEGLARFFFFFPGFFSAASNQDAAATSWSPAGMPQTPLPELVDLRAASPVIAASNPEQRLVPSRGNRGGHIFQLRQ